MLKKRIEVLVKANNFLKAELNFHLHSDPCDGGNVGVNFLVAPYKMPVVPRNIKSARKSRFSFEKTYLSQVDKYEKSLQCCFPLKFTFY